MGLKVENLTTSKSEKIYNEWKQRGCQPNFWKNVEPDSRKQCGPYVPVPLNATPHENFLPPTYPNAFHDTISMVVIDRKGSIAAGSSTNGLNHKIGGRVGDAAVAGGGSYADSSAGGCGSTGNGDIHIRFLPCYQAVENLRRGMRPQEAAEDAIRRILKKVGFHSGYTGAVVVVDTEGNFGSASFGWRFSYAYQNESTEGPVVVQVEPIQED